MPEPIDALVITDTFSSAEREEIVSEARSLIGDSFDFNVWINDAFEELDSSLINTHTVASIFTSDIVTSLEGINPAYGLFQNVNTHSTIVNYLGHRQSLPMRYDSAAFIVQSFFYGEDANFDGGSVTLQINAETAYEHDVQDNMTVIFPASYYHQVSEVDVKDASVSETGLYVITSYLFIAP